mgnify:CR=1 FL=1|jgi:hypothetical protein
MIYTTKYFELIAENNLRIFSNTIEKTILNENKTQNEWSNFSGEEFDIFLSHSYLDKKIIYGIYLELTKLGYSVYIDWLKDPELNRTNVSRETADKIRKRLFQSKCLFYATTINSKKSSWMPWELGFMDGNNQRVAILPMTENHETEFLRMEYLEIYPYIEKKKVAGSTEQKLWIYENDESYTSFDRWITDKPLTNH